MEGTLRRAAQVSGAQVSRAQVSGAFVDLAVLGLLVAERAARIDPVFPGALGPEPLVNDLPHC